MKGRINIFLLVLLFISVTWTAGPTFGSTYYGHEEFGGSWHDAEKSPDNSEDDLMCWAAAASNILDWTGWGRYTSESFSNHDNMFGYFQDHWTDKGGLMEFGWKWWFDGTYSGPTGDGWSKPDIPGGGFWEPPYNFDDYYYRTSIDSSAMSAVDEYLHNGYGVTIAIYHDDNGHALSVWGYDYNTDNDYLGIWITDSDDDKGSSDPPDTLDYVTVSFDDDDEKWYLDGYGSGNYYIGEVQALDQSPVPIPGAIWLFGSGLIGLVGIRRKK